MSFSPQNWKKKKCEFQESHKNRGSKFVEEKEDCTVIGLSQEPKPN